MDLIRSTYHDRKAGPINKVHRFAVLIPLIEREDGNVDVLFETRAQELDAQPGEICFPGGAMEGGESPLETALRETCEEIGVAADDIEIIGEMDSLNNAGLQIDVFVGLLKGVAVRGEDRPAEGQAQRFSGLTLSDAEVEDVFTIPLTFFLKNKPEVHYVRMVPDVPADFPYEKVGQGPDYPWRDSRYSVLIYDWPGRYLWGMTAKIVERFAAMLQE
jgi:8-oxo-dGTP pyrophosphatase MutT (NUDIX family)